MEELADLVEDIDRSSERPKPSAAGTDRRLALPPLPTDDLTAPVPRVTQPIEEVPPRPETNAESAGGSVAGTLAPQHQQRTQRVPALGTSAFTKQTTANVPAPIVDRLTGHRLDRDVAGRPLNLSAELSRELAGLPSGGRVLWGQLERASAELNVGRRRGDDGWLQESRFATRISEAADRQMAVAIRSVHQYNGQRVTRQDIIGLALLRLLARAEQGASR